MKCVATTLELMGKKQTIVTRVSDQEARELVENEGYRYVPKSVWKANGRPYGQKE